MKNFLNSSKFGFVSIETVVSFIVLLFFIFISGRMNYGQFEINQMNLWLMSSFYFLFVGGFNVWILPDAGKKNFWTSFLFILLHYIFFPVYICVYIFMAINGIVPDFLIANTGLLFAVVPFVYFTAALLPAFIFGFIGALISLYFKRKKIKIEPKFDGISEIS